MSSEGLVFRGQHEAHTGGDPVLLPFAEATMEISTRPRFT